MTDLLKATQVKIVKGMQRMLERIKDCKLSARDQPALFFEHDGLQDLDESFSKHIYNVTCMEAHGRVCVCVR